MSHPIDMFCAETIARFVRRERGATSLEWERITGHPYGYDLLKDTICWGDEDVGDCYACNELVNLLRLTRRTLWGDQPTPEERPELWDRIRAVCPQWPGFSREKKPPEVDGALTAGRKAAERTAKHLTRAARWVSRKR